MLGIVSRRETKEPDWPACLPLNIPQYIAVPPNNEAKRIISYFSAVLLYQTNPLL